MNSIDWTPLYRNSIGFDRLASMLNSSMRTEPMSGSPAYNIEVVEDDHYAITIAVAGYEQSELDIEVNQGALIVKGKKSEKEGSRYLYQGILNDRFERRFNLAEHVEVTDARLSNGLLTIDLKREVPESMKPKTIPIQQAEAAGDRRSAMLNSEAA